MSRRIITVIPLITTPVRLGVAAGAALAGHPGTRLAGVVLDSPGAGTGTATWVTAAAIPTTVAQIALSSDEVIWVMPMSDLAQRLGMVLPTPLVRAEDLCRLWGAPAWSEHAGDLIANVFSEPVRQRLMACHHHLQRHVQAVTELLTPLEMDAYRCHRAINARGLHIETALARWVQKLIRQREHHRQQALGASLQRQLLTATEALKPGGPVDRLLREQGLTLSNRSEDALLELLQSAACNPVLTAVLQSLIGHGRIAKTKIDRLLGSVDADDRLRDQLVMWAARTWRFSSHDVQIQNLPKPLAGISYSALASAVPEELHRHTESSEVASVPMNLASIVSAIPGGLIDDAFPAYVRMTFSAAPGRALVIVDWNAIEPRIRAWLSNDQVHLAAWRSGRDLYSELISSIVGRTITKASDPHLRQVGKLADIGCGYHMGADTFAALCATNGVNLTALGLTARHVVDRYREKYYALADRNRGLWGHLEAGAIRAIMTGDAVVGHLRFAKTTDGHLDFILPNGSRRRWWHAEIQMRSPPWAKPGDHSQDGPAVMVASTLGGKPDQVMYGGRILENACQAIGRELLIELIITLEKRGIAVVAHCHDEVVVEVDEAEGEAAYAVVRALAETAPEWAAGLPLKAEGFVSPFWSKESPV